MLTTRDVWKLQHRKVIVHFDEDSGQPDEDFGGLLGSWLGQLSTDVNLLPIKYSDWRTYSPGKKDTAWKLIQAKFLFDDPMARKDYVIGVLGSICKDLKVRLWKKYKQNTPAATLANRPPHVPVDQWRDFVSTRFSEKWKKMQDRNTKSRSKHTTPHICGRKSFTRKRRQITNETGKTPSRAEFFITTRKKADGSFVSDEAKKRADELTVLLAQNPSTQVSNNVSTCLDDDYSRVFGRERSGRVRCIGRGPTPSKLYKRSTAARSEAANVETAKMKTMMTSLQNEVGTLKAFITKLLTKSNDMATPLTDDFDSITNQLTSQERIVVNDQSDNDDHED